MRCDRVVSFNGGDMLLYIPYYSSGAESAQDYLASKLTARL
jgi:hypothetical protein